MVQRRPPRGKLLALFLLSGAASLVYEVAWMRLLGVVLGTDAVAVSIVLAGFMAGLASGGAAGGAVAGRLGRAEGDGRVRAALRAYGLLEVAVALSALAVPGLARGLGALPEALGWAAGGLLLGLPAAAMGATFPLACAALAPARRRGEHADRGAPLLYAVNTLGAVAGTLAAAHLLLPALGVTRTNLAAAMTSGLVGLAAIALAGRRAPLGARADRAASAASAASAAPAVRGLAPGPAAANPSASASAGASIGRAAGDGPGAWRALPPRWALAAAFLAGLGGLGLEVAFARVLAMAMGGTVYAFAAMLAAFLTGIGLGSLAAGALLGRLGARGAAWLAAAALAFAALGALVAAQAIPSLPWTFVRLYRALGPSLALEGGLAALLLLAPALGLGAGFAALLAATGGDLDARAAGRLYAANTTGAVLGALGAGLVLVPLLGLGGGLSAAAAALALAAGLATGDRYALGAAVAAALLVPGARPRLDPSRLATGAFGYVATLDAAVDEAAFDALFDPVEVESLYHRDGRSATVTVERFRRANTTYLKTNGKVEGSAPIDPTKPSQADMSTQVSLAFAPLTLAGGASRVLVIGLGGGVTVGAALALDGVEEVTLVEIEPRVIDAVRAAPELMRASRGALDDPRLRVVVGDARRVLAAAAPGAFDVIVSQPSDPWLSGVANLFTVEAFEAGRRALAPGGRFCQWVQLYGLDREGLATLLATFGRVFPEVAALRPRGARELLLIGAEAPLALDLDAAGARLNAAPARRLLEAADLWPPFRFLGQWVAGRSALDDFTAGARASTDDRNVIEFLAPRSRFVAPEVAERLHRDLLCDRPPPAELFGGAALPRERRLALARGALECGNVYTATAWARSLPADPPARADEVALLVALGDAYVVRDEPAAALIAWIEALRRDPYDEGVRTRVLLARRELEGAAGGGAARPGAAPPPGASGAPGSGAAGGGRGGRQP